MQSQAEELASYFLNLPEDARPTAIFSSPYYRCLQTAQPVAVALNLPLYVEHGLSEWYSPVEPGTGLHPLPGNAASLKQYFHQIDTSYSSTWLPSRLGETLEGIQKRTDDFLRAFIPRVEGGDPHPTQGHHERILLVSHAATCITLVRSLAGHRADGVSIRIGCCSLSTMLREHAGGTSAAHTLGQYRIARLADASFLKNGVERDWGFEDIAVDATGKVINDHGVPGTETEVQDNVGLQIPLSIAHM
ncbi:hypothetical protein FRB99_008672 [Tulasnella sp. 403]|nr:hypothetical protein FRB99_008672 [Tulasnella sp. 403]